MTSIAKDLEERIKLLEMQLVTLEEKVNKKKYCNHHYTTPFFSKPYCRYCGKKLGTL